MTDRIRLALVDDHDVMREGIAALLGLEPDFEVAGSFASGARLFEAMANERPQVVLLDLRMPEPDGFEVLRLLRQDWPDTRVIILTSNEGDHAIARALAGGAAGYVFKASNRDELISGIRSVLAGTWKPPLAIAERLAQRVFYTDLTEREIEVLTEVARGSRNRDIASSLGISEATVKNHVNNILTKLGVRDRTEAVTMALQRGIIELPR